MKTIIFTNARDEYLINEWIAHNILIGFSTVFVYDHLSKIPISQTASIFLQSPLYRDNVVVERIDRNVLGKCSIMVQSYKYAKENGYDWAMYLDADEFLYLRDFDNITQYIQWFLSKQPNTLQIGIPWLLFGSNNLDHPPTHNIMHNFTKSQPNNSNHIKSLCYVRNIDFDHVTAQNPHFISFPLFSQLSFLSDFNTFNPKSPWIFDKCYPWNSLDVYVAHYQSQSYQTYLDRKVLRPRDDVPGQAFPHPQPLVFHRWYNDVTNTNPRDKYAAQIQLLLKQLSHLQNQQL
jgi:hypothetical protein